MKYYFIINPRSGKLNKEKIEENIRRVCLKKEIPFKIMYTKSVGDAKRLAQNIADNEEKVVFSVGGDGNLNEVVNGIAGSKYKILGSIPLGSGNDFDKTLAGFESGIHSIDLGKINDRYFINVACIGLDADVANNVSQLRHKKWIPVSQRYNASLVYTYFKYQFKKMKLSMGETSVENEYTILAVCNGQYYGGGYRIAPHAMINDGLFDIYIADKMPKPKIIPMLLKLLKGTHEESPAINRYKESKIVVDCGEKYVFNVDGEKMKSNHFELSIEKNAIKIFNDRNFIKEILE